MTGKGPGPGQRLLWVLAVLALVALPACGGKEPEASVEGVLVSQHGSTFYFYSKSDYEPILTLAGDVTTSGGELAVGQKVRVNFNGSVLEIAPPQFDKVYSVEILGAAGEELQEGLTYFNTQVKPWPHIPPRTRRSQRAFWYTKVCMRSIPPSTCIQGMNTIKSSCCLATGPRPAASWRWGRKSG